DKWTVAGTSAPKIDARAFVTGQHQYTTDLRPAGLLHGKVLRPPAFGATLISADLSEAQKMSGVTVVRDGDFLAAAAPTEHEAQTAIQAIRGEWKTTAQPSSKELFSYLKKNPDKQGQSNPQETGSIAQGRLAAMHILEQTYTVAYIAHAPLEPRAAVADWKDGKLTVWTGSQRPF